MLRADYFIDEIIKELTIATMMIDFEEEVSDNSETWQSNYKTL